MADQDFNIKVVTTADTSGIRQTSISMAELQKQIQAQNIAAQQMGYQLGQALRVVAGGAIIAGGYKFVSQLHEAATEIERVSTSLDKQGAQILSNAQKMSEMSKFAQDNADIIKIGESALKGVESAHARLLEEAGRELTVWQKISDIWAAGFKDKGPIAQAQELAKSQASQNYEMARTSAIQAIAAAKINETRHASQTYEETVKELNDRIKEQQALANTHWQQQDIQSYLSATSAVEKYTKELENLKAAHDKAVSETGKKIAAADPQVQAILKQEQAARVAREEGRQNDAALLDKSAEAFKRGATPQQLEQVKKAELDPNLVAAIKAAFEQSMSRYWQ